MLNGQLKSGPQKSHEKARNFLMTSSMVFFIWIHRRLTWRMNMSTLVQTKEGMSEIC